MAREGGLRGDARSLLVADLTEHDDVRVLTQQRAQRAGEGKAGLVVGLELINAGHGILDGVLHGRDVDRLVVDLVERGVERGRFTTAGRPGDEHDAVGLVDDVLPAFEHGV